MQAEPKISDVLEAVKSLDSKVSKLDSRVDGHEGRFDEVMVALHDFSTNVDDRFERIETRLTKVESIMVTKDYLDDKLADLRGGLVTFVRTEIAQSRA